MDYHGAAAERSAPCSPSRYFTTAVTLAGILLLASPAARAQTKVANYAYGQPGTAQYERLSFWVREGKPAEVTYQTSTNPQGVKLRYVGGFGQENKTGFKLQRADKSLLYVLPGGLTLQVGPGARIPTKIFNWEYEGPVNGVGTACTVCAADENEAMQLLKTYYFK